MSFDAVKLYPFTKYKLVEKLYTLREDLPPLGLRRKCEYQVQACLSVIKFGMGKTLLTFVDKYYEYDGDMDAEDGGLSEGAGCSFGLTWSL